MSRQAWLKHINTVRFERGPDGKFDKASVQAHAASCPECAKRRATPGGLVRFKLSAFVASEVQA